MLRKSHPSLSHPKGGAAVPKGGWEKPPRYSSKNRGKTGGGARTSCVPANLRRRHPAARRLGGRVKNVIIFPSAGQGRPLNHPDPGHSFSAAMLTCHRGIMLQTSQDLAQKPVTWSTNTEQLCNRGEVCQETLLLIDVGVWAAQEGKTPARGPASRCPGFCALNLLPGSPHACSSKPNSPSFCALVSPSETWGRGDGNRSTYPAAWSLGCIR